MKYYNIKTALALCFLALLLACNAEIQNKNDDIKVYKKNSAQRKPRIPIKMTNEDSIYWENEKRLKPMSIDVDKIIMLSKMKALKKAYNIFWETVAKIYHLADIKDIDAFKNCTLNDTILPLND